MLKAVIFDMDGVLVDTEPVHYQANKQIMSEFGYDFEYDYYKKFIGSTLAFMWEELTEKYDIKKPVDELCDMSRDYSNAIIEKEGYPTIEGAVELVKKIHGKKIKLAVASSSSLEIIKDVVSKLQIEEYFDKLVSGEDVKNPKPAPDVFIKAANQLGVTSGECLVIEDSANGVKAAKNANMACVGFVNKNSGDQDLSVADYLVESFTGIETEFLDMVYCHANGEP